MVLQFIEPEAEGVDPKVYQPASYVRKSFFVSEKVEKATLYMTALGTYIGYFNGMRLDSQLQRPGFTNYNVRLQYQSYDVTSIIEQGENIIAAVIGDGWYRGTLGNEDRCVYGERLKFAARMVLNYASGKQECIETDESWMATQEGPVRENDQKVIERVDMTREMEGWEKQGFITDERWHFCKKATYAGKLIVQEGEPLQEEECIEPQLLITPKGEQVLDFGQNHCGHVEFTVTGSEGDTVSLVMGETLDEKGNFTIQNLTPANRRKPVDWQRLIYVLKNGTQSYKSQFLISGYRYVKLENWPEEITCDNFRSWAIYSGMRQTGEFSCSDEKINQLVCNTLWSLKSNFVEIPTDCPQRERAGWTGDINVFCETANYFMKADRFLDKWLNDYISIVEETGEYPCIVPSIPMGKGTNGSAGWSDAISNVPYTLYQFYGDPAVFEKVYATVRSYVEYNRKRAVKKNFRHFWKHGEHYQYILDTGYHYGEWMEPGANLMKEGLKGVFMPDEEVATAWWYHTTEQLADMAKILGKTQDEVCYRQLAGRIRSAYQKEFLKDGRIRSKRICRYVRPLYMGLVQGEEAERIAAQLNQKCIENNYRIGTGFLTTYKLLPTLSEYGYSDTAYRILQNREYPGWMYAIEKGATTTWENWKGIDENGKPHDSLNHYSAGSVTAWLFGYCAGIQPLEAGYRRIAIRPIPGGGLRWAKARYDSCRGEIVSEWRVEKKRFHLNLTTPVEARVTMPDGTVYEKTPGTYQLSCSIGYTETIRTEERENGKE